MVHCKPKTSTYIALGLILLVLAAGLVSTLGHFASQRTYPIWLYLTVTVILTVVILMLLVKMMAGFKTISAGDGKIVTMLPLRRQTKVYSLSEVLAWDEEKVIANKREFRQLTIVFSDKNSFTISNHEHVNYDSFLKYLLKKIPNKRPKQLGK
jgi:hypothetical protein